MKGFRYGGTSGWIFVEPKELDTSLQLGEARRLEWVADPTALYGFLSRDTEGYHVLLASTRSTLRFAATTELILVDSDGNPSAILPKIGSFYSLDTEQVESIDPSSRSVICTSAEAALLSKFEIKLLARDKAKQRISNDEAERIQNMLAPFLAFDAPPC
ncbi:hypothetical protein [Sphingobium sp. BS19]|uniref:hypothetical protein n=1 Tax=Sphingobium sp. BS19 TaxID=3018973 RepID=UPI0024938D5D|nr:hypothetical protein [Sphingobium sp. BS19]